MLRKHYRLVIDVAIDIEDFTLDRFAIEQQEDLLADSPHQRVARAVGSRRLPSPDRVEALHELRSRLLRDSATLDLWLKRRILEHLDEHGLRDVYDDYGEDPVAELLEPLLSSLPLGARAFFHSAAMSGRLDDVICEFESGFRPCVRELRIANNDQPGVGHG